METFKIIDPKHPSEEGIVDIDISTWLENDTIKSVTYTAKNRRGSDVTSSIINSGLSSFSGHHIRPYIQGGVDKESYKVLALVECNEIGDVGAFVVEFSVRYHVRSSSSSSRSSSSTSESQVNLRNGSACNQLKLMRGDL